MLNEPEVLRGRGIVSAEDKGAQSKERTDYPDGFDFEIEGGAQDEIGGRVDDDLVASSHIGIGQIPVEQCRHVGSRKVDPFYRKGRAGALLNRGRLLN